jgi:hypothetical protein
MNPAMGGAMLVTTVALSLYFRASFATQRPDHA